MNITSLHKCQNELLLLKSNNSKMSKIEEFYREESKNMNKLFARVEKTKLSTHLMSLIDTCDETDPNNWEPEAVTHAQKVVDLLSKIDYTDEEKSVFISRGAFYLKNPSEELTDAVKKLNGKCNILNHVFNLHAFPSMLHGQPSITVAPVRIDRRRN